MPRFLILLFLIACSSSEQEYQLRPNEGLYLTTGYQRLLHSALPEWANFSSYGCERREDLYWFDQRALQEKENWSYRQGLLFQREFNYLSRNFPPQSLYAGQAGERVYQEAKRKVTKNLTSLPSIPSKKVVLVWIDSALKDKRLQDKLRKDLAKSFFFKVYPIIVSECLLQDQMYSLKDDWSLPLESYLFLSAELFSPFDMKENKRGPFQVELEKLFPTVKEFYFYSPDGKKNTNLKGQIIHWRK